MPDAVWKALERRVAKTLGGKRIPWSGAGEFTGDVLHNTFQIECKYRQKFALKGWFEKLKATAMKSEKIPLLVVKMRGQHGEYAVLDLEHLVDLLKIRKGKIRNETASVDMTRIDEKRPEEMRNEVYKQKLKEVASYDRKRKRIGTCRMEK